MYAPVFKNHVCFCTSTGVLLDVTEHVCLLQIFIQTLLEVIMTTIPLRAAVALGHAADVKPVMILVRKITTRALTVKQ